MKYDAISFIPNRPFLPEARGNEFETDKYCLSFDNGTITLHLKIEYLDNHLVKTPLEQRQIRKWQFYIAHLNCVYLLLDGFILRDFKLMYFNLEEITTQNANVVSENGVSISPHSHKNLLASPMQPLLIPQQILQAVNLAFSALLSEFERVYVLSQITKSLAAYKSADFTTSLVLAWFLLEGFIEIRWTNYLETENRELENDQKRINAERRQSLNDHRSYTIAVKLQILELSQRISFKQFSDLDILRDKRNSIVHPKKAGNKKKAISDYESCILAFELLQQFLEIDFDLRLILNTSYSHFGVYNRQ
jgi:hypothetical protein